ncbi:hypothetical protein JQX09_23550 [Sulfitobacter pseudonitzschiae]|uniref:Uncharacterized protein n=1 Tax=Pseudosulfitobacter pseudonitzschiae TaxID=1402135 RepID=A0A9Q2RXV7_9RHOB|nr:hypothetical protein [Pseudosulfitobacter pseudonitzschiae]MBM2294908.1 hypothetical protein [Pseudosulfitobacter pseudonitzschiae]MBM2299824.1 hypothetical protein [Pseudosulfitobacter pseudonitzschiae]MBM2304745.1 hypothetical protein [Pseudosulfitobacter pseudonitzschiae]MBM2314519.1 hypothetical protein [Pseudosulfitobacter pseudonitzschiae]MBM2319429.1 hypothetical protein [Pseudosulfitobacter pseudonitzschiae]
MLDQTRYTAQDALDFIEADTSPLNFGTGVAVYRAAVKRMAKLTLPGLMTHDLSAIPMTVSFIDTFFERWNQQPPSSKKERNARAQMKSRLLTVARRLEGTPVVRTTDCWDAFIKWMQQAAETQGLPSQALIPVTSSLRAVAVAEGLEPPELTRDWIARQMELSGKKRRNSLRDAAKLLDIMWANIPIEFRPIQPFGPLETSSRKRKGLPLPARVSAELEDYLNQRVAGTTAQGFTRTISIQAGIKKEESTNIYRQAVGWLFDALCIVGKLCPDADIGMTDLARLDWIGQVAFEALEDANSDDNDSKVFPWNPIKPETIYNRVSSLITILEALDPTFSTQTADLSDPTSTALEIFTPDILQKILARHVRKEMTDAHRTFCREVIRDKNQQRLILNMHMICWDVASKRWKRFDEQGHHEQMQTMNLCILSAMLAIVVNIPFRARTLTSLVLEGEHPDLSLPRKQKCIEFHVAPERMKVPKRFDATLEGHSRRIIDWFIAGPRRELLRNPRLLPADNRRADLLFCGIGRARYNRVLTDWSEEIGLRMTTHMFRHALASILINCCNCPLAEAARMLGNTVEVTERQYAFQDLTRRRSETLQKLEGYRADLANTQHPGRRRKWKA